MTPKNLHRLGTAALSLSMAAIGLALIAQAAVAGGRGVVVRVVLGLLFLAAGCGRLYLLARRSRGA